MSVLTSLTVLGVALILGGSYALPKLLALYVNTEWARQQVEAAIARTAPGAEDTIQPGGYV